MLILEIIEGHNAPISRRNGDNTYWTQKAYIKNGGPFPIEIKLSIPSQEKAVQIGQYEIAPTAFQAGKYGDLEVNRFELSNHLLPLPAMKVAAK